MSVPSEQKMDYMSRPVSTPSRTGSRTAVVQCSNGCYQRQHQQQQQRALALIGHHSTRLIRLSTELLAHTDTHTHSQDLSLLDSIPIWRQILPRLELVKEENVTHEHIAIAR